MSDNYLNPFGSNNISNVNSTTPLISASVVDNSNASIMTNNSSSTMNYILSPSDLNEVDIELIKKELERKIQEQKEDLENTKKTRGLATSFGNWACGLFGGGDKKIERNISNYEGLLGGLDSDISNIDEVYKTIMGSDLDLASLQSLKASEALANSIDSETQEAIVAELENQVAILEDNFETALNSNGWISGTWNAFKNWTGLGASSNKTSAEINDLKEQIAKLKNGEANLAETFKNITGQDLNYDNLTSLLSGEVGTGLDSISNAGQSVNAYSEGQKMCTDVVADMVSGIAAVGIVAFGTAVGICAAPFTAGASLGLVATGIGLAAGTGALVKSAIKASDCIGNEKTYGWKDFGYDVLTGGINGAAAPFTNALGGAAGTGIMKLLGQEALETTVKSGALIAAKEVVEEGVEQAGKKLVSTGFAKAASFTINSMTDGSLSGFIDASTRALAEGRYEDILSDGWEGFKGGLIAAPIMGTGFNIAGKAGSRIGQTVFGQAAGKMFKEGSQALSGVIDNVLPQGIKRIIQEGSEKLNNRFIQTSLKNCLTISDDGVYSVKLNGYNVQLIESELSEEILEAIAKGDNTPVYNYAQDILTFELRKQELLKIEFLGNDQADTIASLGEKDYLRVMEMLKNDADPYRISHAVRNLDPSLHSRALDLLEKGLESHDAHTIAQFDEEIYLKTLSALENGKSSEDIHILRSYLDQIQYSRALDLFETYDRGTAYCLATINPTQEAKALNLLENGKTTFEIIQATSDLHPDLHSRALDLLEKGFSKNNIHTIAQFDEELYLKTLSVLENGKSAEDISSAIRKLDSSQYSRALDLLEIHDAYTANCLAAVNPRQEAKALSLLETGKTTTFNIKDAVSELHPYLHERALDLIEKGVNAQSLKSTVSIIDPDLHPRTLRLLEQNISPDRIHWIIRELDPNLHSRALDLIEKGVGNVGVVAKLDDAQYYKYLDILWADKAKGYRWVFDYINNTETLSGTINVCSALMQDDRLSSQAIVSILKATNGGNFQAKIDMFNFLKQKEGLSDDVITAVLSCWNTEIKQPLTIKNMGVFSKIATDNKLTSEARELLLCKILNIDTDIEFSKLSLKEKIHRIDILREAQKADIFTTEEKNFLNIDAEIERLQKLIETVIQVTSVSQQTTRQMMSGFFANNNPQLDNLLSTTDFSKFGKEGLPLTYSRQSFIGDLLKAIPTTEQDDILRKLGITLTSTEGVVGYDGIIDLSKLSSDGIEGDVLALATKFIKENSISTGDAELDKALNSLIQGIPELINVIGKQQHGTQDFSVDIHMLTVLKEAMSNPEYQNLSNQDKTCLKFATILHDIAKSEGIVDDGHAEICALYTRDILRKFSLPTEMQDRIYELVKNHHWLANYNKGNTSASTSASLFRRTGDLKIAQIMAEADLKGVKADGSFYTQYADALEDGKQMPVQRALTNINSQGQIFLTNKIIKPSEIPTILHNGVEYRVINFTELSRDFDLQQYGFEPGTTVDNLRLFIHMTDTPEITQALNDPSNEGYLCASYISIESHPTYNGLKFGVSLEAEQANIGNATSINQGSGNGKNFSRFSDTIIGNDHTSEYRRLIPTSIKNSLNITDDEYSELFSQIQRLKHPSQLDYIPEIQVGNKTFTGAQIKEAILKADDLMMQNSDTTHNEANLYLPKVNAVVAKVESLDEVPQELLDFAKAHNLPIYLLGK